MMPRYSIIVAHDQNRLIGRDNDLPWRLSADLQYFKKMTMGKPLLMGRKTYDSIGQPLPGRDMVVLSRDVTLSIDGCWVIQDISQLAQKYGPDQEVMIAGGAQIYQALLPLAQTLYVTEVKACLPDGDVYFPDYLQQDWREVSRQSYQADDKNQYDYDFVVLSKK